MLLNLNSPQTTDSNHSSFHCQNTLEHTTAVNYKNISEIIGKNRSIQIILHNITKGFNNARLPQYG